MIEADFLVVGAGMAGASAAAELARSARVVMIEREERPGYHATGRSAALFLETYGNATIRALTTASGAFFRSPPQGFADTPVISPRPMLDIGRADQRDAVEALAAATRNLVPDVRVLDRSAVLEHAPCLNPAYVDCGIIEPNAFDMDVAAIHAGFLRAAKARGAMLLTGAELLEIHRSNGRWIASTPQGSVAAPVLVNAAGAWADEVAGLAGVAPVSLTPLRRTACILSFAPDQDIDRWPAVSDIGETFYFKPQSGKLLGSPADESPSPPCDAQPEELDIAIAIDRIMTATTLNVTRVEAKWAGLRSFVPDRTPVVGFDEAAEGFFWLAGQGGYGIQTAPALARITAALATGKPLPGDIAAFGVDAAALSPARLRRSAAS